MLDRSKVADEALVLWLAQRQSEAMVEQFAAGPRGPRSGAPCFGGPPASVSGKAAQPPVTPKSSQSGPRRGEFWLAFTPGQPDDPRQPRPVLVISEDVRNTVCDDVIVVPAFSRGRPGPTWVTVGGRSGGLPHESVLVERAFQHVL